MSAQPSLPFPKPKRPRPSPLVEHGRIRAEQVAVARIIYARPELYCRGLQLWARKVLFNEHETSEVQHADDDFQT